ncbi:MAG: hypothetical protein GC162_08855 [Planctomycetes bacterium]|nr:hypothetical protein [Planctomycetota bacterium]
MSGETIVSLAIRAVFDADEESVGVEALPSEAFEAGDDARAKVEILAAITARANALAAQVINQFDADESRRKELFEHYAFLKESILSDMLQQSAAESEGR